MRFHRNAGLNGACLLGAGRTKAKGDHEGHEGSTKGSESGRLLPFASSGVCAALTSVSSVFFGKERLLRFRTAAILCFVLIGGMFGLPAYLGDLPSILEAGPSQPATGVRENSPRFCRLLWRMEVVSH